MSKRRRSDEEGKDNEPDGQKRDSNKKMRMSLDDSDEIQLNELVATIPTHWGMVLNGGAPRQRQPRPNLQKCLDLTVGRASTTLSDDVLGATTADIVRTLSQCITRRALVLPHRFSRYKSLLSRVMCNVYACTRADTTADVLKDFIRRNKRIDIEQAVGLVISLLNKTPKHHPLIHQLLVDRSTLLLDSHMWMTVNDFPDTLTANEHKLDRFRDKFNRYYAEQIKPESVQNLNKMRILLDLLRRIRHSKSKKANKCERCLRIPVIVYEYLGMIRPESDSYTDVSGSWWPERDNMDIDPIYVGRRKFNRLNRLLKTLLPRQGRFEVGAEIREKMKKLKEKMKCGNLAAINGTGDVLSLCYSFITFQRKCQPKIVSNAQSNSFLKKGQNNVWFQNDPRTMSSFENTLVDAALAANNRNVLDLQTLTAVTTPRQVFGRKEDTMHFRWGWQDCVRCIDETALLMEEYVVVHGGGSFDNLCFQQGVHGGSRGPVDDYNLLCDILRSNIDRYKDAVRHFEDNNEQANKHELMNLITANLPLKNYKFLAKDILHWNNAWKDDAFADGKRPDWVKWLEFRRNQGIVVPPTVQCK